MGRCVHPGQHIIQPVKIRLEQKGRPFQGEMNSVSRLEMGLHGLESGQTVGNVDPLLGQQIHRLGLGQLQQIGDADVVSRFQGFVAGQIAAQERLEVRLPRRGDGVDLAGGAVALLLAGGLHPPSLGHLVQGIIGRGWFEMGHEIQVFV